MNTKKIHYIVKKHAKRGTDQVSSSSRLYGDLIKTVLDSRTKNKILLGILSIENISEKNYFYTRMHFIKESF